MDPTPCSPNPNSRRFVFLFVAGLLAMGGAAGLHEAEAAEAKPPQGGTPAAGADSPGALDSGTPGTSLFSGFS
jgi:hypothetical protein